MSRARLNTTKVVDSLEAALDEASHGLRVRLLPRDVHEVPGMLPRLLLCGREARDVARRRVPYCARSARRGHRKGQVFFEACLRESATLRLIILEAPRAHQSVNAYYPGIVVPPSYTCLSILRRQH